MAVIPQRFKECVARLRVTRAGYYNNKRLVDQLRQRWQHIRPREVLAGANVFDGIDVVVTGEHR